MCAPISGIILVFFLFTGTYNNTQWNLSNQDTNWAEGSVLLSFFQRLKEKVSVYSS